MSDGLSRARAILAHQLNDDEHPAWRQEKLLLAIAESLADIADSVRNGTPLCRQPSPGAARTFREGDVVRVVGGVFGGKRGEVREWDGSTYRVLVRNQAGFPWYVQLSPTQVEPINQPQEDT